MLVSSRSKPSVLPAGTLHRFSISTAISVGLDACSATAALHHSQDIYCKHYMPVQGLLCDVEAMLERWKRYYHGDGRQHEICVFSLPVFSLTCYFVSYQAGAICCAFLILSRSYTKLKPY
jgi:hypothetical protein